jgi:hypothetical protein
MTPIPFKQKLLVDFLKMGEFHGIEDTLEVAQGGGVEHARI